MEFFIMTSGDACPTKKCVHGSLRVMVVGQPSPVDIMILPFKVVPRLPQQKNHLSVGRCEKGIIMMT